MLNGNLVVGRKAIIKYFYNLGFLRSTNPCVWRTIVYWQRQGNVILRHDGNNRPFIIDSEIKMQKIKQSEKILGR